MISKKIRFEVFKRDGFACQYCGKKTPEVTLEVDHIVSVNDGGQDDITNLITSCFDCNRGKGKTSLDEIPTQEEDLYEKTILLLERERQIKEYNKILKQIREREDRDLKELRDFWNTNSKGNYCSFESSMIRRFLKLLPKERIKDAIEIANSKQLEAKPGQWEQETTFRYFCGILNNWFNNKEV